jgi:hypothetical protein
MNRFLQKKQKIRLPRLSNIIVRTLTFIPFTQEPRYFQVIIIWVLCGAYCFFNHFDEFVRVAPEQEFGFFRFLNYLNYLNHLNYPLVREIVNFMKDC